MNDLPKTNQCHKCKEWFHTVHVCASDVKVMPKGCTTATGCRKHGCRGDCLADETMPSITIPRALVEQALEAMEPFAGDASGIHKDWADERRRASLTQDKPLTVAHFRMLLKASEALRAALQAQPTKSGLSELKAALIEHAVEWADYVTHDNAPITLRQHMENFK